MNYLSKENVQELLELSLVHEDLILHHPPETAGMQFTQIAYTLAGKVESQHMQQALDRVVEAHAVLRSVFRQLKNRTVQVVLKQRPHELELHDLCSLTIEQQQEQIDQLCEAHRQAFVIDQGPLIRFALVTLSDQQSVLLLTYHHLILDAGSRRLVIRDLLASYEKIAEGSLVSLEKEVPYKNYLNWLSEQDWSLAKSFWKEQLGDFESPSDLLAEERLTKQHTTRGIKSLHLTADQSRALEVIAAQAQVTSQTVLQAAWAMLLHVYNGGEQAVCFGINACGYPADVREFDGVVASCMNELPLRLSLAGEQSLYEFLANVQKQWKQIEAFAFLPLHTVRGYAGIHESIEFYKSKLTVFESMPTIEGDKLQLLQEHELDSVSRLPLGIEATLGKQWQIAFSFDRNVLSEATVDRISQQLYTLLQSYVASPEAKLAEFNLLPEEEYQKLYSEFNRSQLESAPLDLLAHQVIERTVERQPDQVAATCLQEQITYRHLNERANALAHWMRDQGVGRDDVVVLFADRNISMLVAILAVLKAGAAYVPLDAANPDARNLTVVQTARTKVILTQSHLVARSMQMAQQTTTSPVVFCLDDAAGEPGVFGTAELAESSTVNPVFLNEPRDLANVFFTSGSTGLPKGAMVEHLGMLNHLWSKINLLQVNEQSVVVQNASHCFDISVWQFLAPLMVGGRVAIYPNEIATDPLALLESVNRDHVTVLELVPAMIELLLQVDEIDELPFLRELVATGEGLPTALCNQWLRKYPKIAVVNAYGLSETSDDFMHERVTQEVEESRTYVPLGTPIPNNKVYLLDPWKRMVPIGCVGEIYLTGIAVGRGYLHDEERTAKAFLVNQFADGMGDRLYKTGDLGYFLHDGRLVYMSRSDFQVKVRGNRIELGEVEAAIRKHPDVLQCVAIVRADASGQNRLLAYLVLQNDVETTEMREFLKEIVPEYMIPDHFIRLDALPLNQNGKIDRKALPDPNTSASGNTSNQGPRNETEAKLVEIWESVLDVSPVGIDQKFFELGGHSLKTIKVRSRMKNVFGVDIPLKKLFENQTIQELAGLIDEAVGSDQHVGLTIPPAEPRDYHPLSNAQRRLYFLYQMDKNNLSYNMPSAIELVGELDEEALVRAFQTIVERHAILHSAFDLIDGIPVQKRIDHTAFRCPILDLSTENEEQKKQQTERIVQEELEQGFDLEAGMAFRVRLIKWSAERHVLVINMHHIVSDFWSWNLLFEELQALYLAYRQGQENPLSPLPIQFADFAVWQNDRMQNGDLEAAEQFWLQTLSGELPVLELPTDHPRPPLQTFKGLQEKRTLDPELTKELYKLSNRGDTTLYVTLLTAFGILLSRLTGQDDLIVGTPEVGRNFYELEGLIGIFINTLPLRLKIAEDPTFLELVSTWRDMVTESYEHHEYPFEQMVELLKPERDLSRSPIFSVIFQVLRDAGTKWFSGMEAHPLAMEVTGIKFDLEVDFVERDNQLELRFTYRTDLFEQATILRWMDLMEVLLRGIVKQPEQRLSQLPLLPEAERHMVVEAWNETKVVYENTACLHRLFEEQVRKTPDAVALTYRHEQLTYSQLNAKANRLAHHLQKLGVGEDVLVGVCMERSFEMLIALYGILKAGGAYVPLDPTHPQERIAYTLQDSQVPILLTEERLLENLPAHDAHVICLDSPDGAWEQERAEILETDVSLDALAYVIYTSGSTGQPKGVMNTHRAVSNMLLWMQEEYRLSAEDAVMLKTAYSFDVSVWELFWPLGNGARLVISRPDGHRDPAYLAELIREELITTVVFVPSALQVFLEEQSVPSCTTIRRVLCIGEALPYELQERFFERVDAELYNLYGPTEAAVHVTNWKCRSEEQNRIVPIGRPIANAQMYVLDKFMQPVPIGVVGELYIGGMPVARGYWKREKLTAERFVQNPFLPDEATAKLYRTGDLVRYRADGTLEYLGRMDQQVKFHGYRIELGEIENVLMSFPLVREAAVLVYDDAQGDSALVAYVVAEDEVASSTELRRHLLRFLPEYMVPTLFITLDSLPMLANDKLDRKALPSPKEHLSTKRSHVAPRTQTEWMMVKVWEEVLHVPVGIYNNFFDIGGHSLKALALMSAIEQQFSCKVSLATLFQYPTVAELSEQLAHSDLSSRDGALLIRQGDQTEPPLFLVHGQGGGANSFYHLAKQLGEQQTVYGIQSFGYDSDDEPLDSIEAMADRYVKEIERIDPQGPYRIAGWSFGGTVAYEIARRLEEQGKAIEFLGLLDVFPLGQVAEEDENNQWTERDVLRFMAVELGLDALVMEGMDDRNALDLLIREAKRQGELPETTSVETVQKQIRIMAMNGTAMSYYFYQGPIQSDLHLFWVSETSKAGHGLVDPQEWDVRTKGHVFLYDVPGDHNTMVKHPHVLGLADEMRKVLTKSCLPQSR